MNRSWRHHDVQEGDLVRDVARGLVDGLQEQPPPPDPDPSTAAATPVPSGVRMNDGTTIRFEEGQIVLQDNLGAITQLPFNPAEVIPPEVPWIIGLSFGGLIGLVMAFPIGRAVARYIDRRGTAPRVPADVADRLAAIEHAIDAVAVEVERVSEAHRYTTKLLVERGVAPDVSVGASGGAAVRAASVRPSDSARG